MTTDNSVTAVRPNKRLKARHLRLTPDHSSDTSPAVASHAEHTAKIDTNDSGGSMSIGRDRRWVE